MAKTSIHHQNLSINDPSSIHHQNTFFTIDDDKYEYDEKLK